MVRKDPILDTKGAAEYLGGGVSPRTLERWRRPSVKKGPRVTPIGDKKVGYKVSDLEEWLRKNAEARETEDDFVA